MKQQVPDGVGWWWFETVHEPTEPPRAVLMRDNGAGYLFGVCDGWVVDTGTPRLRWLGRVAPPGSPTAEEHAAAVEQAFRQGYSHGFVNAGGRVGDVESAWWGSEARAALQGAGEGG